MPNFDQFERETRHILCSDVSSWSEPLDRIAALPTSSIPQHFKGLTVDEMKAAFLSILAQMSKVTGQPVSLSTSSNNKIGYDFKDEITGITFEVKFTDAYTNANVGMSVLDWVMGTPYLSTSRCLRVHANERFTAAVNGDVDKIAASKKESVEFLSALTESHGIVSGVMANEKLNHVARCFARNINTLKAVKDTYGRLVRVNEDVQGELSADEANAYVFGDVNVIITYTKRDGAVVLPASLFPDEDFIVHSSGLSSEKGTARYQLVLKGSESGIIIRFYLNYKNSRKAKGMRVEADNWVSSACFNVWVK